MAQNIAVTSGYALAFRVGAALIVVGGGVAIRALFERVDPETRDPQAEMLERIGEH